jgi:hypothetical protein
MRSSLRRFRLPFQVLPELGRPAIGVPAVGAGARESALCSDDESLRIRIERFGDQGLVGLRAVAFGGVEEVDAELDRTPEDLEGVGAVLRLAPDVVVVDDAHRPQAEAIDGEVTDGDGVRQ